MPILSAGGRTAPSRIVNTTLSPRRKSKKRSAEVRNSLRLFGLLAVLAGVNVYVFFFNRGTAPREILKPSSTVNGDGKAGVLREAAQQEARAADRDQPLGAAAGPSGVAATQGSRPRAPQVLGPASAGSAGTSAAGARGGDVPRPGQVAVAPPKGRPGGSPGSDEAEGGSLPSNPVSASPPSPGTNLEKSATLARRESSIGDTDTLSQILLREGFDSEAPRILGALSRLYDPKLIRGGQRYIVRIADTGEPEGFELQPTPATRVVITRAANGDWVATRVDQPVETKLVGVAATIDSSLYESVQAAGEESALASQLVEVLAWDVNFYTDIHPGDYWKVIVEKQLLGGRFYQYGRILAAEYGGQTGRTRAFYWKANRPNAEGHYYDERGQALTRSLLKTPLRFVRISSGFARHRFHPVLHTEKAHLGIDYAAPVGTPVWASSMGKVVECRRKPGSGNTVVLAHGNGVTTRYYHLSRFARGMKAGKIVKQREVIGYVGTTGLSTGPHLHFSVTKNGAYVDPNKMQINRDAPVSDPAGFTAAIKPRVAWLRELDPRKLVRN